MWWAPVWVAGPSGRQPSTHEPGGRVSVGAGNCSQGSGAAWPSVTPDRDPRQELWREGLALLGPFRDTLGMRPLKEKAPRRQEAAGPHPQTRTACLAPRADEKLEHKAQAMLQHKDLPPGRVTPEAGGADLLNRKNLRGQGNTQRCEETTGRTGPEVQAPSPGKWFTSRRRGKRTKAQQTAYLCRRAKALGQHHAPCHRAAGRRARRGAPMPPPG